MGVDSPIFAIALIFAFVVMYDACGVRRAAGKQAKVLNDIVNTPGLSNIQVQEKLQDRVRHLEGTEKDPWVLVDLGDIIVHLFTEEERNRVRLEQLIESVNFHA